MTTRVIDLPELVKEASRRDNPVGPRQMLVVLSKMSNPSHCDSESEQRELHEAQQKDLGAIYQYQGSSASLTCVDREIWIDRLAWLLQAMKASNDAQPKAETNLAILRTAAAFQNDRSIWNVIPEKCFTTNLMVWMSAFVGSTQLTFRARKREAPIWEHEAVDSFLKADAEGDWLKIENNWQTIIPALTPDGDFSEAVKCLNATEFGRKALATALDKMEKILSIALAANAMKSPQIIEVAMHCTSNRARFGLVQSLAFNHPRNKPLPGDAKDKLTSVFRSIQDDQSEWEKWMQALNKYPVRITQLQPALGASLVNSSSISKLTYIGAIELRTLHSNCREAISDCLRVFHEQAELADRQVLWELSYKRWHDWNFDRANKATSLSTIAVCNLDYAVIGYIVENMSEAELSNELQSVADVLSNCQNEWHKDRLAYDAAWFRSLSRWQIVHYANCVRKGKKPWEWPKQMFLPFDPEQDRYSAISLNTRLPYNLSVS